MRTNRGHLPLRVLVIACAAILGTSVGAQQPAQQTPAGQAPTPTFRATTHLIVQSVTVKDKDGKPIEGLTTKDFTVVEDGQPQEIAFVEFQRITSAAVTATGATAEPPKPTVVPPVPVQGIAPVIAPPPPGSIKYQDRRLLVFYFDTSSMGQADQLRAFTNARKYLDEKMAPADLIALMEYKGGAVRVRQDFTDDRNRLREVLTTMMYGEDLDGDGIPDNTELGTAFGQDDAEFTIFNTDRQLAALQTAIAMFRPLSEQKTLLYFTSGIRLNGTDNQAQQRATVNAAIRANVTLNPIDARGLVAFAPLGDATQASRGGLGMFTGGLAASAVNNFQRSQDSMFAIAKDTGGKAMFDYNDLSVGIADAADALTSYYILGYYSTHIATDGKYRRLKVGLTNAELKADLSYRQGYFAEKTWANMTTAEKERQLEEAFMLDDPITEIPIAMEVNYFQLNRAEYFVPIAAKIPGSELTLARRRGASRTVIDIIGEVKDNFGYTQQNFKEKLDVKLTDDAAKEIASRPVYYDGGFTLLPGKYVVKLLARDAETGRIGTYQTSFEIPNLEKEEQRLPISTVVLSSQRVTQGEELFTVKKAEAAQAVSPLVSGGEKLLPSVTRVFSKARDMYVFLQVYERKAAAFEPLVAFVSFYRDGEKVFETQPIGVTDGMDPKTKAIPLRFSVPLSKFETGRYDLQVTVLNPSGQRAAFWQAPIVVIQ